MNANVNRKYIIALLLGIGCFLAGPAFGQFSIDVKIPKMGKIKNTRPKLENTEKLTDNSNNQTERKTDNRASSCKDDMMANVYLTDIEKTRKEAEGYKPGVRDYYVQDFSDRENIYLKASLSPSRRNKWLGTWPANIVQCITPALENLAVVAKSTLPTYRPTGYTLGTPAELKVLKSGVNDLDQATVFKVGLSSPTWNISKDSFNFPTARFRYGLIWAKYSTTDDGFCRIIYVNLVQDYAGGGTYGESYGNLIKSEYAGCPVGK